MNKLDKWAAEQCGVEILKYESYTQQPDKFRVKASDGIWRYKTYEWTLSDPRCMQLFRKWYLDKDKSNWVIFYPEGYIYYGPKNDVLKGYLKESEYACAEAIYEASKGE